MEQHVTREDARESFKREALTAWMAYQKVDRHLTGWEVRDWLRTWGTNDEKAVPTCHR